MARSKCYFDINIVLDIIDSSRLNHALSISLLRQLVLHEQKICISEDMLSTIYYISKDKKATLEFFENIVYVDWEVVSFGIDVIKVATQKALHESLDLEDLLQCLCAKENGCHLFVTKDKKFYDCGIKIVGYEYFEI